MAYEGGLGRFLLLNMVTRLQLLQLLLTAFTLQSTNAFVLAKAPTGYLASKLSPLRSATEKSEAPPVNIGWDSHKPVSEVPDR